jgi:hypothetical protein
MMLERGGQFVWTKTLCFRSSRERAYFSPFLLYHLLLYGAPSLWTIFLGVLSRILGRKRHDSGTLVVKALLGEKHIPPVGAL